MKITAPDTVKAALTETDSTKSNVTMPVIANTDTLDVTKERQTFLNLVQKERQSSLNLVQKERQTSLSPVQVPTVSIPSSVSDAESVNNKRSRGGTPLIKKVMHEASCVVEEELHYQILRKSMEDLMLIDGWKQFSLRTLLLTDIMFSK